MENKKWKMSICPRLEEGMSLQLVSDLFGQLVANQLVGLSQERFEFPLVKRIKALEGYPMIAGDIRRRLDAVALHELGKLLRGTFERHHMITLRLERKNDKHLIANAQQEIILPLDALSDVG